MTPFTITIEITEATQCHHAVSQLLRVFPKLRLTIIAEDERIPTPARAPQTCHASDLCGHCYECAALGRAIDAIRCLSSTYRAAEAGRVGTDEARQAAERAAKSRAEADAVHSQNISECNAEADKRAEADADVDDSAYQ